MGDINLEHTIANTHDLERQFDFGGETVAGNVVMGPPDREPIDRTHMLQDSRMVKDMERHAQ